MREVLSIAQGDPRYCGRKDLAVDDVAAFNAKLERKVTVVAEDEGTIVAYLTVWVGGDDHGHAEQSAWSDRSAKAAPTFRAMVRGMAKRLLVLGCKTVYSDMAPTADVAYAVSITGGKLFQRGTKPGTDEPHGSYSLEIDVEKALTL